MGTMTTIYMARILKHPIKRIFEHQKSENVIVNGMPIVLNQLF